MDETRTNRKAAALTGPLMSSLWQNVKLSTSLILRRNKMVDQHHDAIRQLRKKWGERPPQGADQWKSFFLQLMEIEDGVNEIKKYLSSIENDLEQLTERAMSIVEANGVEGVYSEPVAMARHILEIAERSSRTISGNN